MKLFYRKYGSGPPLIILHGLYGSSDNWVSVAKSISDKFMVILPDLRNHGYSPHSEIHDYDSMKNDVFELASDLNLERFFLAGHSMGGKTAVNFAITWPEKLLGILIADISPFSDKKRYDEEKGFHLQILNCMLSIDLTKASSRSEIESSVINMIGSARIAGLIMKNLKRENENQFIWKINTSSILLNIDRIMEPVQTYRGTETEISGLPVYFIRGDQSDYLQESDFSRIRLVFPSSEFITIPGAGHWIHSDNPEAVRRCLLRFLDNT